MIFEGACVSLVTPFNDKQEIDYFSLKNLINFQIACGIKAILFFSDTGEGFNLTKNEKMKILKFCSCIIDKKIPVIAEIDTTNSKDLISSVHDYELAGSDAVLINIPAYTLSNFNTLISYFKNLVSCVSIPVILKIEKDVQNDVILKLSMLKEIAGFCFNSSKINIISELTQNKNFKKSIFLYDDNLSFAGFALGVNGIFSSLANCYPEIFSNLCNFGVNGDYSNAKRLYKYLLKANHALCLDIPSSTTKYYMNHIGLKVGSTRVPLGTPNSYISKLIKEAINSYEN